MEERSRWVDTRPSLPPGRPEGVASPDVVVFGGGVAGARVARALSEEFRVTLVDPNDYFEVPMAAPRCLVMPDFARQSIIPFSEALPDVTRVRGRLVDMGPDDGIVQTPDGERLRVGGRVNVLATGSVFANELVRARGCTSVERRATYEDFHRRLSVARRILIVGGGPIGIEIAGEIAERHPRSELTLVEAGRRILASTSEGAARFAHRFLTSKGVSIITGERIVRTSTDPSDRGAGPGIAETDAGRRIAHDLILWCSGGRPNTACLRPRLADVLDANGRIRVTSSLRVAGHPRLFALGDITNLEENKMAWHIDGQVAHALVNIRRVLAGQVDERCLVPHRARTGDPRMAVTLGSRQGVLQLPFLGVVSSPWMTRQAKAGHLLVPKYRRALLK